MPIQKFNRSVLEAAIVGFEHQKKDIDIQISELRLMLNGGSTEPAATPEAPSVKRKKFSAAARRRMKAAQQLRWAKIRGESEPSAPATSAQAKSPKAKRRISKEGMARIVAATKARWAKVRAEKAKAQFIVARTSAPARNKPAVKRSAVKRKAPAAA
jgi:hypothetical protein